MTQGAPLTKRMMAFDEKNGTPDDRRSCLFGFFVPNMLKKDKSLSRYPEFAEYKRHSGLVIPKLV